MSFCFGFPLLTHALLSGGDVVGQFWICITGILVREYTSVPFTAIYPLWFTIRLCYFPKFCNVSEICQPLKICYML